MRGNRQFHSRLRSFIQALSAQGPYGGGSAAAAASACAAALLIKALAYSRIKNKKNNYRLNQIQRNAGILQKQLLISVDKDAELFRAYLEERGPERKQQALLKSSRLVLAVLGQSCAGIGLIETCFKDVNRVIFSDIMISFLLFIAAAQASCVNLRINNRYIKDSADRIDIGTAEDRVLKAAKLQKRLEKEFRHGKNT